MKYTAIYPDCPVCCHAIPLFWRGVATPRASHTLCACGWDGYVWFWIAAD